MTPEYSCVCNTVPILEAVLTRVTGRSNATLIEKRTSVSCLCAVAHTLHSERARGTTRRRHTVHHCHRPWQFCLHLHGHRSKTHFCPLPEIKSISHSSCSTLCFSAGWPGTVALLRPRLTSVRCRSCSIWEPHHCQSFAVHCLRPVEPRRLFRLLLPVSRGPDSSWDSRRALHKSPPNELDRGSSIRGSGLPLMRHDVRHVKPSGWVTFWQRQLVMEFTGARHARILHRDAKSSTRSSSLLLSPHHPSSWLVPSGYQEMTLFATPKLPFDPLEFRQLTTNTT